MKRTIRTNKWHAVTVKVERNHGELDIRINSLPDALQGSDACSAYLTPTSALKLASTLTEFARYAARRSK